MFKSCIFTVVLFAALPSVAHAQIIDMNAPRRGFWPDKVYDASNREGAPYLVEKALGSLSGPSSKLGFATCRDDLGGLHYFLRQPRPNHHGVCRQYQQEIFPRDSKTSPKGGVVFYSEDGWHNDSLDGWTDTVPTSWRKKYSFVAPRSFALLANGDCPPVSDPQYIEANNITDGMFKAFDARWREILKSQEAFDAAFSRLRPTIGNSMGDGVSLQDMRDMEARLRTAALQGKVHFFNLSCPNDNDGCTAYANIGINIGFDASETGIEFTYLLPTFVP